MNDVATPSALPGVRYGTLERHADQRGSFRELWRAGVAGLPDGTAEFVQANLSTSARGVLRGLHLHRRQLDYWVVAGGRAFVALVDVRGALEDPATAPLVEARELGADDWVVIPPGVAHGFKALAALELLYFVTNQYDGSDELGFAWDDPTLGIPWPSVAGAPATGPIISVRDSSNPPLTELLAHLRDDRS
jgi:dTDP-4-dehydrorhamnose 3,5-epimerase